MDIEETTILEIRESAALVARDQREYEAAVADERRALAAFLDALRTAVRPALPALASQIDGPLRGIELLHGLHGKASLFLLESGEFSIYDGVWSSATPETIAAQWRARDIVRAVGTIERFLDEQLKDHHPRPQRRKRVLIDRARRMAAKLQAVTVLLRDSD